MGKHGPKKTPTEILKLSGTWRGKKRGAEPQPEKAEGKLRRPSWVRKDARAFWRRTVRQLGIMGVLTMADECLVARYANVFARWRAADAFVAEHGEADTVRRKGKMVCGRKFPQGVEASRLLSELLKMEQLMGLSPSARADLAIENKEPQNEPDDVREFFTGAG